MLSYAFPYDFILENLVWKPIVLLLTIVWCVFAFVSLPISLIALSLLHIYRYTVAKSTKYYRHDLGKMLTTTSSMVAASGVHKNPEETILITFIVDGEPETKNISAFISESLVYNKNKKGFIYPELQQYVTTYGGFYFYKWEQSFQISEHLRVMNEFGTDDPEGKAYQSPSGLLQLRQELLTARFPPKKSPWEFIVIRGYVGEEGQKQTAVVFRIHHCIVDGYSLLKLVLTQFAGKSIDDIRMPEKPKVNLLRVSFKIIQFVVVNTFRVIYSAKTLLDKNDWHRFKIQSAYNCMIIRPFPLEMIHAIKNSSGTSFTTVVLAIVTGVIRRMMIRKQARLPKTIRIGYPFPRSGHPDKLRNHFTAALVDIPVGTESALERLNIIEKRVKGIKNDLVTPAFFTAYATLIGGFFHWLLPPFCSHYLYTAGLTNFPGPQETVSFCGQDTVSADLCISIPRGNVAVGVGAISYMNRMHMSIQMNKALVNEDEKWLLQNYVFEEIELLKRSTRPLASPGITSIEIPTETLAVTPVAPP